MKDAAAKPYKKPQNMVMIAATVKGKTVVRDLIKDVLDILCEPRNARDYAKTWGLVVGRDKQEAQEVWEKFLLAPEKIVFGEVILPERLR